MTKNLLVRPTAYPDEWTWSWIARAARCNGLTSLHPQTLSHCAELLKIKPPQLGIEVKELRAVRPAATQHFGASVLPNRAIRRQRMTVTVCPACIHDEGYVRQHWRLVGCEVCPQHGCVLRTTCDCCGKKFGLQEVLQKVCMCGRPIVHQQTNSVTEREVELAKAFEWSDATPSAIPIKVFAWQLLIQVARARRGRDVALAARRLGDHAAEWLQMHHIPFVVSEAGIAAFLLQLPDPIHQVTATTWLIRLLEEEQTVPTAIGQLPLQRWLDALRAAGAPIQRDRQLGSKSRPPEMPGFLPLQLAARRLQVATKRMRRWVKEGHLTTLSIPSTNHPFLMVSERDVQHCKTLRAHEPTRERALRDPWLGNIGRCARRQLRIGGLMDSPGSDRSVRDMPVGTLLERMSNVAPSRDSTTEPLIPLTDPRWWSWHEAVALCQWLKEASDGRRPVFRDEKVSGFDGLYTSADQMLSLHRLTVGLRWTRKIPSQNDLFDVQTPDANGSRGANVA